jgi:uroporphyrinogen decarboxylase
VGDLIPDFIELGIDVLHPLEPVPGLDVEQIKREYGRDLTFLGGIDITKAMPGTVEDVRADVDRCLETLAPGGGYILAPSNHLQEDVPAENVVELYTYAQEAGRY